MSYPTDKSDKTTLPDPELNPLLNPLLAAHMGRWAEVYFTSPPEKRDQAVAELLRELETDSGTQPASPPVDNANASRKTQTARAPDPQPEAPEDKPVCAACGHNNPEGQRFCGMCGGALIPPENEAIEVPHSPPITQSGWREWKEPRHAFLTDSLDSAPRPERSFTATGRNLESAEPVWRLAENDIPHFAQEPEPVAYRHRLYIGAALAILLAALVYLAWRGKAVLSGDQASPPAKAVPAEPAPVAAEQPSAKPPVVPVEKVEKPPVEQPANLPAPALQRERPREARVPTRVPALRPAAGTAPMAQNPSVFGSGQSGAEELATAQRYLNTTPGAGRNSGEAVPWLWRAVSKGNPAATIVLSDLYLHGDGVPKNCDQARLLLDAAAQKGVRGAGERLRNLQAFGCR